MASHPLSEHRLLELRSMYILRLHGSPILVTQPPIERDVCAALDELVELRRAAQPLTDIERDALRDHLKVIAHAHPQYAEPVAVAAIERLIGDPS